MIEPTLAITEEEWIAVGAVAASVAALPAAYGTFVWLRGIVRAIKGKWRARDKRIADEAVAKANHEREIQEALKKAETESKERAIRHAAAEKEQQHFNQLVLELQRQLSEAINPQTETIVATVKEESGKAVSSSAEAKREAAETKEVIARVEATVNQLTSDFSEHKKEDKDNFSRNDSRFDRMFAHLGIVGDENGGDPTLKGKIPCS